MFGFLRGMAKFYAVLLGADEALDRARSRSLHR